MTGHTQQQTQAAVSPIPAPGTVMRPATPPPMARLGPALSRRLRLVMARLRWPRVHFGPRCDIRRGLHLHIGTAASIEFGPECIVDRDMTIECEGSLRIGARTIFGHHCTLACVDSLVIGPDCLLAEMVSIRDHDHCFHDLEIPTREQGLSTASVEIGRNVWIGAKVTVTKGVRIGDNAVVGANAVVTRDVPANAVVGGVPARLLRMRGEAAPPD